MEDHLQHVKAGDKVVCIGNNGYAHLLTENKEYVVVRYEASEQSYLANFRWPAYMVVLGDNGEACTAHAHRFRLPTGIPDPFRKFRIPRGWLARNFIGPFMPHYAGLP